MSNPTVCIIGAGFSGLAAAKALRDRNMEFDCYEAQGTIGGLWAYDLNPRAAAYQGLHINTFRDDMQFVDFPMPRSLPDFPSHRQVFEYVCSYADAFDLRRSITLNLAVTRAHPRTDGTWLVHLADGTEREYRAVIVANGHHWDAKYPTPPIPGAFDGVEMHVHDYRTPETLSGKRVVVIGMGNSAMDVAVEGSYVAEHTILVARHGVWISPKTFFGATTLPLLPKNFWRLPWRIRQLVVGRIIRLAIGDYADYGLPRPTYRFGRAHPTTSDTVLSRLRHGAITVKPAMVAKCGESVRFSDGTAERADVIVYATGYHISFPFLDDSVVAVRNNRPRFFMHVFPPGVPNIAFVGLVQPLGAVPPAAEVQARLVAAWLAGSYQLPDTDRMRRSVAADERANRRRFTDSTRHTIEVDIPHYFRQVQRELARGSRGWRCDGLDIRRVDVSGAERRAVR